MTELICKLIKAIPEDEIKSSLLILKIDNFKDYIYGAKVKSVTYELMYTHVHDLLENLKPFSSNDILELDIQNKNIGFLNIKPVKQYLEVSQMNPWITMAMLENSGLKVEDGSDVYLFKIRVN
jgi:hypothetical protein